MDNIAEDYVPMFDVKDDGKHSMDDDDQMRTPTPVKKALRRARNRLNTSRVKDMMSSSGVGTMRAPDSEHFGEDTRTQFFVPMDKENEVNLNASSISILATPANKRQSVMQTPPSSGTAKVEAILEHLQRQLREEQEAKKRLIKDIYAHIEKQRAQETATANADLVKALQSLQLSIVAFHDEFKQVKAQNQEILTCLQTKDGQGKDGDAIVEKMPESVEVVTRELPVEVTCTSPCGPEEVDADANDTAFQNIRAQEQVEDLLSLPAPCPPADSKPIATISTDSTDDNNIMEHSLVTFEDIDELDAALSSSRSRFLILISYAFAVALVMAVLSGHINSPELQILKANLRSLAVAISRVVDVVVERVSEEAVGGVNDLKAVIQARLLS